MTVVRMSALSTSELRRRRKGYLHQYIAAAVVNLSGFAQGMVVGWPAPVLPYLQSDDSPLYRPLTVLDGSLLGSFMAIGGLIATPIFSYLANHHSRKLTGYLIGIPEIIGWIIVIFAKSNVMLLVARIIIGIGCGANLVFNPVYVTEISEDCIRGSLGTLMILLANSGVLLAYVIGSYVSYNIFNCICLLAPVIFIISFVFMPETPTYLLIKNRHEEARRSLVWLRGGESNSIDDELKTLTESIKISQTIESSKEPLVKLITKRGFIIALIIGVYLMVNIEFTGIFAVLSYTVNIFHDAGTDISPNLSTIVLGTILFFSVFLSTFLIDKAGRKILLIGSNLIIFLCLIALGTFFYFKSENFDVSSYGWIPLTSLSLYAVSVAAGIGTVPFIVIPEIFELNLRSMAMTISLSVLWAAAFVVAFFYESLCEVFGIHGCYWFFGLFCLSSVFFCYFVIPETKNRSIDSILRELNGEDYRLSVTLSRSNDTVSTIVS